MSEFNHYFLLGYNKAIKDLRDLNDTFSHVTKWSHSRDLYFCPVELSDWLLINLKKEMQKSLKLEDEKVE